MMQTGYFGVPGKTGGKVHIVDDNNRPVCNTHLPATSEFQWCYNYVDLGLVECEKCKNFARKYITTTPKTTILWGLVWL